MSTIKVTNIKAADGTSALTIADSTGDVTIQGTGAVTLPSGTTAQRPSTPAVGDTRFNTTSGTLEVYSGTAWLAANEATPTITSISGTIYAGVSGRSLTITGTQFNTDNISIEWLDGSTQIVKENNITPTSSTSVTRTIPQSVYDKASGTTIGIRVLNAGSVASNTDTSKSVIGLPSGGTVDTTSVSGYRIHTFTSSSATGLVNTINNLSVEYLVIGAGGAGNSMTGGGAGGYRTNVSGQTSGRGANAEPALTLAGSPSGTNHQVTIEAGGVYSGGGVATNGGVSSFSSGSTLVESFGGGRGSAEASAGISGGCGGGGHNSGGSGTSGQGYDGGQGVANSAGCGGDGGGGGGAGSAGSGRNGGNGQSSTITNTSNPVTRGGGGAGEKNLDCAGGLSGTAGSGGGGATRTNGSANFGGGGGSRANGGSGIVIVRYQIP